MLTATLLLVSVNISAQTLSVKPIEVQTGEQTEMVINLTGGTSMTALQFNLQLPEGVTAAKDNATLGDATNGHTLSIQSLDSGDLLFVLYSLDQVAFANGELLRLPLTAGDEAMTDNGTLYSVRAATVDAVSHTCADASFTVTVTSTQDDDANFMAIEASGNTVGLHLDYNNAERNTLTLLDTYTSLTVTEDIPMKQISYVRNFSNTNWQSLYVPFEIPVSAALLEEFEFAYINAARQYDFDDDGTVDDMTIEIFKIKKGTLLANTPYLIRATATGTKTITVNDATLYATEENSIDCSTTSLLFTFKGGYSTLGYDDIGGCYLLGGGTWNPVREGGSMKPMRFYLKIGSRDFTPFKAPVIRMTVFGEDGEATEIEASPKSSPEGKELIFDLQGRPVDHPDKGIYILNGQKVLVQ